MWAEFNLESTAELCNSYKQAYPHLEWSGMADLYTISLIDLVGQG